MFERLRARLQRRQLEDFADLARAEGRDDVADAIEEAKAGVPIVTLFMALMPIIASVLVGEPINWASVLKIIQDLLANRTAEIPAP